MTPRTHPDTPASDATASSMSPVPAPASEIDAFGGGYPLAVLLSLVAMAVATYLLRRWAAGRRTGRHGSRQVTVVETVRLADHLHLSVVRYKGHDLLVAHGAQSTAVLVDHAADEPPGP